MYGDSTTKGQETINGQPYFTQFNEPWQIYTRFTQDGIAAEVGNYGLSGTRAYQMLNGQSPYSYSWTTIMSGSPAKVVTVNFGMNDAVDATETAAQFQQNLVQIVQIAKSYGKTVLLETPNRSCEPAHAAALPQYVAAILAAGQQTDVTVIDHFDEEVNADWQANLTDCIHPNDTFYGYKGSIAYPYIKAELD
ncbi:lysophospholipase L1-like esterase [Burkholderia sp. Ch1-1]|nr:lysophospholipase L1-like esterase [Burkholderia sp. Ch1-1]